MTSTYTIAHNGRTSFYEVHVAGCKHLISSHLKVMSDREAESGLVAAADFEAGNEGCISTLGPCAAERAVRRSWNDAAPQRVTI